MIFFFGLTGCCRYYQFPSISSLSTDVIVGHFNIPKKVLTVKRYKYRTLNIWESSKISKLQKIKIWTHSVTVNLYQEKDRFEPLEGLEINLEIVDEFGDKVDKGVLNISKINSQNSGYNDKPITFYSKDTGVFRIKAVFNDNNSQAVSYSPPIIVMD